MPACFLFVHHKILSWCNRMVYMQVWTILPRFHISFQTFETSSISINISHSCKVCLQNQPRPILPKVAVLCKSYKRPTKQATSLVTNVCKKHDSYCTPPYCNPHISYITSTNYCHHIYFNFGTIWHITKFLIRKYFLNFIRNHFKGFNLQLFSWHL